MGQKIGRRPQTQLCGDALIPCAAAQGIFVVVTMIHRMRNGRGERYSTAAHPKASPLRRRTPKPLLEERWHGEAVTERCAAHRAAARQRPSAHAETLQQTFGAATPLSLASRASSPQGEPSLSGDGPQSLFWRGDPKEAPYCVLGFCGNRSRFRMRLRGIRFSCGGNFLWLMQAGCILVTTMAYGRVGREGAPEYGGQNGYFL